MNKNKKQFSKIRTAVIGVGSMGQNHARIYSEISNLVCVVDPDEKQGKKVAGHYGVKWYPDHTYISNKVDAVTIAVPTSFHLKVAEEMAKASIDILVEKPMSENKETANKILDLSKKYGIKISVGHIERHNPVVEYAKKAINSGQWGNPLTFTAKRFSNFPSRITDVGVIFDLSVHDIDLINYLSGSSVTSVYALGGNHHSEAFEDYVNISLNYSNGMVGLCQTNWLTPMKVRELHITTDKRYIVMDLLSQSLKIGSSEYGKISKGNLYEVPIDYNVETIELDKKEPLLLEIEDFLESIVSNKPPLVSGRQGLEVVKIAEACCQSLKNNEVIFL